MILNDNSVPTIEEALKLVDTKAENFDGWKVKGLGLRLVLLGLSELQALRLSKLAGMVYKIEGQLLNKETIDGLDPKQLFQLYQLSTKALTESSEFVERTLKSTQWAEIETELLQAKAQEVSNDGVGLDAGTAQELLAALAKINADKTEE